MGIKRTQIPLLQKRALRSGPLTASAGPAGCKTQVQPRARQQNVSKRARSAGGHEESWYKELQPHASRPLLSILGALQFGVEGRLALRA